MRRDQVLRPPPRSRDTSRHRDAPQRRPMHVAYRAVVAISRSVANDHFAQFVKRQLAAARARGMKDADIEKVTGITNSTFHRWQRGDFGKTGPSADAVRKFCDGLGLPRKQAAEILGWSTDDPPRGLPDEELSPEIRELLRRLRDPNIPKREKEFISETIKSLISRTVPRSPTRQGGSYASQTQADGAIGR